MKPFLVLDIETAPLEESRLREIMPVFKANGTLKDPEKIKADLSQKEKEWFAESALHATRGKILCAGTYHGGDIYDIHCNGGEGPIIQSVFDVIVEHWSNVVIVGHNIFQFDLPYLCRRALHYGIAIPGMLSRALRGYYPPAEIFDTMLEWRMSNREERISLDALAWHLGVGRKNGSGADFARLWNEDRPKAIEYLQHDLQLAADCYRRMTFDWPPIQPTPQTLAEMEGVMP